MHPICGSELTGSHGYRIEANRAPCHDESRSRHGESGPESMESGRAMARLETRRVRVSGRAIYLNRPQGEGALVLQVVSLVTEAVASGCVSIAHF
jgi:hypothetical protein